MYKKVAKVRTGIGPILLALNNVKTNEVKIFERMNNDGVPWLPYEREEEIEKDSRS